MIGGPPMMSAPQFAPQYAMPGQPLPQYNVPAALASTAPPRAAPPSQPMTTTAPRPVVRAQAADEPNSATRIAAPSRPNAQAPQRVAERPAPLNMPRPEDIGVSTAGTVDWSATHARLERLGATCFHEEKLSNGTCRVNCVLPSSGGALEHRVEAEASSEAEAVQVVLAEAERWNTRK